MEQKTITITADEYDSLKKKAKIADDIIYQLEMSVRDAEAGRIKRVA